MAFRIEAAFQFSDLNECRIPTVFQLCRNKPVFGIGGVILAAGTTDFIFGFIQREFEGLALLIPLVVGFLLYLSRRFDAKRLAGFENRFDNGLFDAQCREC